MPEERGPAPTGPGEVKWGQMGRAQSMGGTALPFSWPAPGPSASLLLHTPLIFLMEAGAPLPGLTPPAPQLARELHRPSSVVALAGGGGQGIFLELRLNMGACSLCGHARSRHLGCPLPLVTSSRQSKTVKEEGAPEPWSPKGGLGLRGGGLS